MQIHVTGLYNGVRSFCVKYEIETEEKTRYSDNQPFTVGQKYQK